jgi:hypothetical protein
MEVQFVDFSEQYRIIKDEIEPGLKKFLKPVILFSAKKKKILNANSPAIANPSMPSESTPGPMRCISP